MSDITCNHDNKEYIYVGEHWDNDEGWCSTYVCKACYPNDVRRLKHAYQSHVYRCKNPNCDRCHGEGLERKKEIFHHPMKIKGEP